MTDAWPRILSVGAVFLKKKVFEKFGYIAKMLYLCSVK